jgi:hypothetical protein
MWEKSSTVQSVTNDTYSRAPKVVLCSARGDGGDDLVLHGDVLPKRPFLFLL